MKHLDPSLDWEVTELPVFDQSGKPINGYKRLINSESQQTLSVCKESYTPTKNERLLEVVHTLCNGMGFSVEGFASFKGGKRVLAYLKNPEPSTMIGLDTQDYMIVGNAHDGSSSFFTGMTNYIYRCENMFSSTQRSWRVYHTKSHDHRIDEVIQYHDMYYNERTGFYEMMESFAGVSVNNRTQNNFVSSVLKLEEDKELSKRMTNIRDSLVSCIALETRELGNSAFGLFNGLTRYTSRELQSKNPIFGNPFGHANTLNKRGLEFCKDLAKKEGKNSIKVLPRHQYF